ncbi:MAG: CDP-alcohol phosphatidyltransferase family protein [Candidatus Alcyoniella australis]|nr:CDP-alcohol phosphatidyltransferase family protein [Candidatus Alcyoniella australis]
MSAVNGSQRGNFNLPNALTVARAASVPLLVVLLCRRSYEIAFWLFVAMAVSDLFDGLLARLLDSRTDFGANLDPLADKLTQLGAFLPLALVPLEENARPLIPLWIALVIVARDLMITGGIVYLRKIGRPVPIDPLWIGKVCTNFQFYAASSAILLAYLSTVAADWPGTDYARALFWTLITVAVALTVWSGVKYFIRGLLILRGGDRETDEIQ